MLTNTQLVPELYAQGTSDDQREWLVLFTLVWTPYLSLTEANLVRGVHGTDGSIKETLCVKLKAKKRPQTQFFTHILEREMSHANNRSFREASASQNASTNIPREKKTQKETLLLAPQTKAEQRNERQLALVQNR